MSTKCQRRQRVELHDLLQMVGGQVGIAHRHRQVRVPEGALKHKDVAAIHHEVRCKGVTQNVCELSFLQLNARALNAISKR